MNTNKIYIHFFFFFLLLVGPGAFAQPAQDIRMLVKTLNNDQKLKLLEYLRQKGASIDREIQQVYEQVSTENREKALQYIEILKKPQENQGLTQVKWNRDTAFFGKITEGRIILDSFKVTNVGREPYLIRDIKTSCDCTVMRYPKFPVLPGETATIRVEFNSQGKVGKAIPGIIIYDNSSPNQRNLLYLNGEVTPKVKPKNVLEDKDKGIYLNGN